MLLTDLHAFYSHIPSHSIWKFALLLESVRHYRLECGLDRCERAQAADEGPRIVGPSQTLHNQPSSQWELSFSVSALEAGHPESLNLHKSWMSHQLTLSKASTTCRCARSATLGPTTESNDGSGPQLGEGIIHD